MMNKQKTRHYWNSELIEIKKVYSGKRITQEFWVSLIDFSEYKNLAEKAVAVVVQMPTTYLCEKGFSRLVEIKSKKRNSILNIDCLMQGRIEKEQTPRYDHTAKTMQEQASH